jgi:hypothetical protein
MSTNGIQERWGRETRLLVLVVVVSIAVLMVLARFRFPAPNLTVAAPAPGPLAGLAGRSAFDELGSSLNTLLIRVSPRLVGVRVEPAPPPAGRGRASARAPQGRRGGEPELEVPAAGPRAYPALRLGGDRALVYVPEGMAAATLNSGAAVEVLSLDAARHLAIVRVPAITDSGAPPDPAAFSGFTYVGEVDATASGHSVRPQFMGPTDPATDPIWPGTVFNAPPAAGLVVGTFVFTLDGRLVGLVAPGTTGIVIVPSEALNHVVNELPQAGANPA